MNCNAVFSVTRAILFATLVVSLPAHAARPRAATVDESKHFVLDQDVIAQRIVTVKGNPGSFTLGKCTYRLTHVDRTGGYFTGQEGCFRLINWHDDGKSENGQGGVWIPSDLRKSPRLYMVVRQPKETCGNLGFLICQLSMLEDGRFKLMPGKPDSALTASIQVVSGTP